MKQITTNTQPYQLTYKWDDKTTNKQLISNKKNYKEETYKYTNNIKHKQTKNEQKQPSILSNKQEK